MNREARRAALEAIVLSDDASPGDRLRALDLLDAFESDELPPFMREVMAISDDQLDAELADLGVPISMTVQAVAEAAAARGVEGALGVVLSAVIANLAERRAQELVDTERIEAEIDRRAEKRARELAGPPSI